jgi:hypothetical protein
MVVLLCEGREEAKDVSPIFLAFLPSMRECECCCSDSLVPSDEPISCGFDNFGCGCFTGRDGEITDFLGNFGFMLCGVSSTENSVEVDGESQQDRSPFRIGELWCRSRVKEMCFGKFDIEGVVGDEVSGGSTLVSQCSAFRFV